MSSTEAELPAAALADQLGATVQFYSEPGGDIVGVEPSRTVESVVLAEVSPTVLVLPGGLGWRDPAESGPVVEWITRAATCAKGLLTVSTGSLLLAATGLISGEAAAGHWLGRSLLRDLGADSTSERIATSHDSTWVTASGSSAAVDAAKPLADRILWGRTIAAEHRARLHDGGTQK